MKCDNGKGVHPDGARGQALERDLRQKDQDLFGMQAQLQQRESVNSVLDYELARLREEVKLLRKCILTSE